jgi:type IV secretory pathway VirD2 relaxase
MTAYGQKAARTHLAYLERDGVERDGSPGRLYGADDGFRADELKMPLADERRQFRLIVSPEDGDRLDLAAFARAFMAQVEKDTGRRLIWAAVNHHNTDNPHIHIVIRGVDRDGDEVRIDGKYIANGMRRRAQEIATRELGPRVELEFSRFGRSAQVTRERFTEIDRMLAGNVRSDGALTLREMAAAPIPERRACLARLEVLQQMRLAQPSGNGTWQLAQGWEESLRRLGERNDMIQHLSPLVGAQAIRYQVLDATRPLGTVEGVVTAKGLDNELSGQMFMGIVTEAGDAYYVRLAPESAEALREGERVRMAVEAQPWLKPADKIIARAAQENGGVYDPARHQRVLENASRAVRDPEQPSITDRIAANVRRLERLSRYGLAWRLPDGRWQVPPDLLAQLEARERSHPQRQIRVEPTRAPVARERDPRLARRINPDRTR